MSTAAEKHPKRSPTPKKVKHEIGKSDIDGSRSKPNQDKMKTSDGIKQRGNFGCFGGCLFCCTAIPYSMKIQ